MEITIPKQVSLILIQEIDPWRHVRSDLYEYRPPMLVIGEEWNRIDKHQRGMVRSNDNEYQFTGVVPSADHDKQSHIDSGSVVFGKMKWRHLESMDATKFCAIAQEYSDSLVEKYSSSPGIIDKTGHKEMATDG